MLLRSANIIQGDAGTPVYWPAIAAVFQGRSNDDCRKRWAKIDDKWMKGAWDSQEDELLRQGVDEFGYRSAATLLPITVHH